jgi:hypothetical protein
VPQYIATSIDREQQWAPGAAGVWPARTTAASSPPFDSVAVGRQVIALQAEVDQLIRASDYERAATQRDRREALQRELAQRGDPIVARNVLAAVKSWHERAPLLQKLEKVDSTVDADLLRLFEASRLPPRWLLRGKHIGSCRATLAKRLETDSLASPFFRALLPVFGPATFGRATHPMEWLTAAIQETARSLIEVVWLVEDPLYLAKLGMLDLVLQVLSVPSVQFVVRAGEAERELLPRLTALPNVIAIGGTSDP